MVSLHTISRLADCILVWKEHYAQVRQILLQIETRLTLAHLLQQSIPEHPSGGGQAAHFHSPAVVPSVDHELP